MFEVVPEKGFTTSEKRAYVVLEDGTVLQGKPFGYPKNSVGEIVFNTGMVGYTEALTDPSYKGQILTFTYPLVGNYGVPSYMNKDEFGVPRYFESDSIKVEGVVVYEHCKNPSHWSLNKNLNSWLYEEKIPGVYDIDTRELTKKLRVKGVMMGALIFDEN
ncbi:MAG: carbamoyl-phosphate synthase domain-containing protein, partial [Thermoproteota archaeon]